MVPMVLNETKGEVASGPFKGMRLVLGKESHVEADILAKLLGIYEEELHSTMSDFARKSYDAIVTVDGGEGYYAVGFSRLFPNSITYGYESNPAVQEMCHAGAQANEIQGRLVVRGFCSADELAELRASHTRMLCLVDCEGFEPDLLDEPTVTDSLRHSDVIIECHDHLRPGVTDVLSQRFAATHNVKNILSSGRDLSPFPFLRHLSDIDRELLTLEMRPCVMNWLVCEAKDRAVN